MPMMLDDKALAELEGLRDAWGAAADVIERTHGEASPAAKTFRVCIADLYRLMERRGLTPERAKMPLKYRPATGNSL